MTVLAVVWCVTVTFMNLRDVHHTDRQNEAIVFYLRERVHLGYLVFQQVVDWRREMVKVKISQPLQRYTHPIGVSPKSSFLQMPCVILY